MLDDPLISALNNQNKRCFLNWVNRLSLYWEAKHDDVKGFI